MIQIVLISQDERLFDFCQKLHNETLNVLCVSSVSKETEDFFCHVSLILFDFDLILSGYNDLLELVQKQSLGLPLALLVNETNAATVMQLYRYKSNDLIMLPCCTEYLHACINRILRRESSHNAYLDDKEELSSFICVSDAMKLFKQKLIAVAKNDLSVLIIGETGTGKSFIARLIHKLSSRKDKNFVEENVAAIQETLIEGELFGTKVGAYTGAISRIGLFEHANNGTLFLDEIACIKNAIQAKLLQVLETGVYRPVGSVEKKKSNVRLISATNLSLTLLKNSRVFRDDLYFRISGVQLHVPPLRSRKEDIYLLSKHFLEKVAKKSGIKKTLTPDAVRKLESHEWPGNVRELERCIECAYFMTSRLFITATDISFIL